MHVCQLYSVLNLLVITLLHLFSLTLTANVLVFFFLWGFPSACTIYVSNISLLLHRNNVGFFFAAAEGIISGGLQIAYLVWFLETVFHLIDGCNLVIISAHSARVQGDLKCK